MVMYFKEVIYFFVSSSLVLDRKSIIVGSLSSGFAFLQMEYSFMSSVVSVSGKNIQINLQKMLQINWMCVFNDLVILLFPDVQRKPPVFSFVPTASGPGTGHCWQESGFILSLHSPSACLWT